MKHVAAYMRVSSDSQSHDSQEGELRKYLVSIGLNPDDRSQVVWYVDTISGREINREQLRKLRDRARQGMVSKVVCWKIDRLGRRMIDGINLIHEWLENDISVVSVTQQFDFSGPIGKAVAALLFALAEAELQNIRDRIRAGIERAKSRGKKWGGCRYRRQRKLRGSTIASMQNMYHRGLPIAEIAAFGKVHRTSVYKIAEQQKWSKRARKDAQQAEKLRVQQARGVSRDRSNEIIKFVADAITKPEGNDECDLRPDE